MNLSRKALWIFVILTTAYTGCRVAKPSVLPAIQTPASFSDSLSADSSTIADLPWNKIFTDQTLVALIDTTLRANPDLLKALRQIDIARNQYQISQRALQPTVNAEIGIAADRYGDYTMTGVGNFDTNLSGNINGKQKTPTPITPEYFVGFRSSWEIDVWGRLKNLKKAALARFIASEEAAKVVQTSLVAEVASRYYKLLALDNELAIIHNNIRLQDSALQIVKYLKQTARANELAVQQFSAQLLNTKALEGGTRQQILEVENELNFLQGKFKSDLSRDKALFNQPLPEILNAGLPSGLILRRPDIRRAEQNLLAAKADLESVRASFYPAFALTPYLGLNSFKLPLLFSGGSLAFGALGNIVAPVLNQGRLKRGLAIADATRQQAYLDYRQNILNGFIEVSNALGSIANNRNVLRLKQQEAQVLRDAVSTSNILFKTGYASYLEVITAQRTVLEAELQMVRTREEMYLSFVDLYRSLGGGWK